MRLVDKYPKPRTKQRTGNYPYVFVQRTNYSVPTGWILDKPYVAEWLQISVHGVLTVKANKTGYAWDGCTPKRSLFNLWVVGAPDGHFDHRTGKPFTYYASMVHDALYQYLDTIPVPKKEVDRLFLKMLGDFKARWFYYSMVRLFGGRGVKQRGIR